MNITILLQKLIDIEQSIGVDTDQTILEKVLDLEGCLLEMQREMIRTSRRSARALDAAVSNA